VLILEGYSCQTLSTENSSLQSAKRDLEEAKRQISLLQANLDKYKQRSVELTARNGELELHIQMRNQEIAALKGQVEELNKVSKQQESMIRSLEMRQQQEDVPRLVRTNSKPRGETLASLLASSAAAPVYVHELHSM
jgi:chromosome segregation ATPase